MAAQHVSCERAELKAREEKVLESANATYYVALKTISLTYFHEVRSGAPVAAPRAGRSGQRQVARAVRVRQGARTRCSARSRAFSAATSRRRRAAAARAAPSTPRLVSAARVGPVVYGLLLTFRGDGYG